MTTNKNGFSQRVIRWQGQNGRHNLPWQQHKTRYRVWVSEIMLQQTQVATVIPYFEKFIARFPNVGTLAKAPLDDVLAHWSGLGYYARARNMHAAAEQVVAAGFDDLPTEQSALIALPGIGRSTAAAILSLTDDQPLPILDGNVKRVFARHAAIQGWTGSTQVQKSLWQLAEQRMPSEQAATYNQGLMDLGSLVCRRSKPLCEVCPVATDCQALATEQVTQLPSPKPKRAAPRKTAYFLVAQDRVGATLVERRAPVGIWGGLWSLPQFDSLAMLQQAVDNLGLSPSQYQFVALEPFEHAFSHFRLELKPYRVLLSAEQKTLAIAEESRQFVPLKQLGELGLPAPIRRLLGDLTASSSN